MAGRSHKHPKLHEPKQQRDFFDYVAYLFTFAAPMFEIPQAVAIYTSQSAQDVSVLTWGFFCLDNFVWMIYAKRRRLWPLLITSILFEIVEFTILVGILLYR